MRSFLNAILAFIGASALTDLEFASVTITVQEYSLATYEQLLLIVDAREAVSNTRDRLAYYFLAKDVDVVLDPNAAAKTDIYVGSVLGD